MKTDVDKTAILRFRVPAAIEQEVKTKARRWHLRPHEFARFALAAGLASLATGDGQHAGDDLRAIGAH